MVIEKIATRLKMPISTVSVITNMELLQICLEKGPNVFYPMYIEEEGKRGKMSLTITVGELQ